MAMDLLYEADVADRGQRADEETRLPEEKDAIVAVPHDEPQLHAEDRIPGQVEIVPDRTRYPRRQLRPPEYYGAVPY